MEHKSSKKKQWDKRKRFVLSLWSILLLLLVWAVPLCWREIPDGNVIVHDGKEYIERPGVTNILIIGSDVRGTIENTLGVLGGTGQADFLCLLSIDRRARKISVLSIPRDTLVEVQECDRDGSPSQRVKEQICLQYGYSMSSRQGCELTAARVSELLGGTTIDYYFAGSLGAMSGIVDEFGGVDICMSQDYQVLDQTYQQGEVVHLSGEEAKIFLHYRDTEHYYTNLDRMARQRDFLRAFVPRAKEKVKRNLKLPFMLLEKYEKYATYDIPVEDWPRLGLAALCYDCDWEAAYVLPGEETHQGDYDAYVVDDVATESMILDLFYQEN